jgi:large subunit ribosomal protein L31
MKKNIHPDYHPVKVVFPDGSSSVINSCYGKDEMHLHVHYKTHPAWCGGIAKVDTSKTSRFDNRYAKLNFGSYGTEDA